MATINERGDRKENDPNVTFTNESLSVPAVCEETGGRLKVRRSVGASGVCLTMLRLSLSRLEVLSGQRPSTTW
jgi:hypothetical protein